MRWLLKEMLSSLLEIQLSSTAHGNLSWSICAFVVHWNNTQRSQSKPGHNSHIRLMLIANVIGLMARDMYIWSSVWRTSPWSVILWNAHDTNSHTAPRAHRCSCKRHFELSSSEHTFLLGYFYSQWEKRNSNFQKPCNSYRPEQNFIERHLIPKTVSEAAFQMPAANSSWVRVLRRAWVITLEWKC